MDFRNCFCDCLKIYTWVMNIIDYYIKYIIVMFFYNKIVDEVLLCFTNFCYIYGFSKKIIIDNGGEF